MGFRENIVAISEPEVIKLSKFANKLTRNAHPHYTIFNLLKIFLNFIIVCVKGDKEMFVGSVIMKVMNNIIHSSSLRDSSPYLTTDTPILLA